MRLLLLLGVLFGATGVSCTAAASVWQSMSYDGREFVKGGGPGALQVRDGYLPMAAEGAAAREEQLPEGTGAVAVYCYQQRSGGKLASGAGRAPITGVAVTVSGKSLTVAARTDERGYLILALPPGEYQLQLLGFTRKVAVDSGKTTLVAMRGGKRMVD